MSTHIAPTTTSRIRIPSRRRVATVALWTLQILLAALFLSAGGSKLAGAPAMVQLFDAIGIGQWFRYVTGALEIVGALTLLVPRLAGHGALLLSGVMLGAIGAHLFVLHSPPVPAVFLAGLAIVAFARRADIIQQLSRLTH